MSVTERKQLVRRQMEARRAALTEMERAEKSRSICTRMLQYLQHNVPAVTQGRKLTLFSFVPFRSEVDVMPVIEWCWAHGHTVVVPKVNRAARTMDLYRIEHERQLSAGTYGIREPSSSGGRFDRLTDIDIMLVPGIAFDRRLRRLGYGGGYYDRFLARVSGADNSPPLALAPAFHIQLVREVPFEPHDYQVDVIVTERQIYAKRGM